MQSIAQRLVRALRLPRARSRAVMIVGMHRSGTSFLTGSLQRAGLELGHHSEWNPFNTRGNRENPELVDFHERLLAARGRAWDHPPEGAVEWTRAETAAARELIANYASVPLWGFKDPRALLFVHGWRRLLPRLRFVGIFRHPVAVARSLAARGGMPEQKAFDLWLHYNHRLLALHAETPFPLLCFDQPEAELHRGLDAIQTELGLGHGAEERFWAAELRHHDGAELEIPAPLAGTWRALHERLAR